MFDHRFSLCVVLTALVFAQCQGGVLHELIDVLTHPAPECYSCSSNAFPGCINNTLHRCSYQEKCSISYAMWSPYNVEIKCVKGQVCPHESTVPSFACPHGGDQAHSRCVVCCESTECVSKVTAAFLDHSTTPEMRKMTSPVPTTTTEAPTTTSPEPTFQMTTSSVGVRLAMNCDDRMASSYCATLRDTQSICSSRSAVEICPKTCGVCEALKQTPCQDQMNNQGCLSMATEDFCQGKFAKFTCPFTCKLCGDIYEATLDSLFNQTSTS